MIIGSFLLAGLAGRHDWVMWIGNEYTVYLLSAVFSTFGFVIQDVTADTMTTEVVERTEIKNGRSVERSEKAIRRFGYGASTRETGFESSNFCSSRSWRMVSC